jgi:hypothetical protein
VEFGAFISGNSRKSVQKEGGRLSRRKIVKVVTEEMNSNIQIHKNRCKFHGNFRAESLLKAFFRQTSFLQHIFPDHRKKSSMESRFH